MDITPLPSKRNTSPGDEIDIDVLVKDKKGDVAANVEVCLVVVDERLEFLSKFFYFFYFFFNFIFIFIKKIFFYFFYQNFYHNF